MFTRHRTIAAACPMSGIPSFRAPRAGWRRDDPGDTGDGGNHGSGGGGSSNDGTGTGAGDGKAGDQGDGDGSKTPKIDGDFDADRAARSLAAAREGEKKAKAEAKAAKERTDAILRAAGLTPDGKTDPELQLKEAAERADKATKALRDKSLRLAVRENADKAGVEPAAVIDSSSFRDATAELDPEAADYDDQVVAAMKKALKANSRLAATPAGQGPARLGADHSGAGGGSKERPKTLREAFARKNNQ